MGKLTEEQAKALAELEALRDSPDDDSSKSGTSRVVNVHVDLSDPKQVERAQRLGLLDLIEDDDDDGDSEDGDGEDEPDDVPKRRSYFQ